MAATMKMEQQAADESFPASDPPASIQRSAQHDEESYRPDRRGQDRPRREDEGRGPG